ncbi:AraC family transcriptional regulator [Desulforamulus ruminis]
MGKEYRYKVSDQYGSGYINRIILGNGIEINIVDVIFNNTLRLYYKINKPPFEAVWMISGELRFYDSELRSIIKMQGGSVNITFTDYMEGWMEYQSKRRYKYVSVCVSQPLSKTLCTDENLAEELNHCINIDHKLKNYLLIPQKISPFLQVPFQQIQQHNFSNTSKLIYMESKAKEIVVLVFEKEILRYKAHDSKIRLSNGDISKMYLVKKIIIENMEKPFSILELSEMVGLNTYKLKVGFKELFGTTVFGYLRDIRMEKARLLLENYKLNINEIANEVGYSNPSHFAAAFKKKYGLNPRNFRYE